MHLKIRPRRNRSSRAIRNLIKENRVSVDDLIMPLFVKDGDDKKTAIKAMPGQFRYNILELVEKVGHLSELGIKGIALFPVIADEFKNTQATEAYNEDGLYPRAIKAVKNAFPSMLIMTDIALDPYSSDGHDGLVDPNTGKILNDETIEIFKKMALMQARAGSDILGPSDMMDGRVRIIRDVLEAEGFSDILIMSYCVKYASSFYGPFRDALDSTPKKGDKKTYQMDYCNSKEVLREIELDTKEGADILMVKPGLAYLDIVKLMSENTSLPVAVFNVSGEYSMVKLAAQHGLIDEVGIRNEMLTAFKRAGANIILTYFAEEMATFLNKS